MRINVYIDAHNQCTKTEEEKINKTKKEHTTSMHLMNLNAVRNKHTHTQSHTHDIMHIIKTIKQKHF